MKMGLLIYQILFYFLLLLLSNSEKELDYKSENRLSNNPTELED